MFNFNELGQGIINELSLLIKEEVILTDARGFIQVSTDPTRVNQFHEGALLCIKAEKLLHMKESEVSNLRGVRKGVVIPIIIDDKPIAILGITGDPKKIQPQALLIRRVVELFIQDSLKRQEKDEKIREFEFFMIDWITSNTRDKQFYNRAELLDIEVELYTQVVMIQALDEKRRFKTEDVDFFMSVQLIHPLLKASRWGQEKIILVLPEMDQTKLKIELENLLLHVKRKMKMELAVGIGERVAYSELALSFNQSERAVKVSQKYRRIVFERELLFDLIIHSLPKDTKERFIERTVAPLQKDQELLHNLRVWFSENQSMKNTAQKLHIHKNTLAYRLQKVEDMTGLYISEFHDVFLIYLGIRLLDEINSE
ncbi:sugar diacid recognition domain-containing protein [Psychrobacillus sp. FSL H8-0483]|uniref:sugar diacid recognition domain-containing protein n=1 Tax=Psychrobacillus sp. FSL H8-0483 TaxID=2921389 RepID=UPI00315B33D9